MTGTEPLVYTILISVGIFVMGVWYGKSLLQDKMEDVIEETINSLISGGYLRYKHDENGEIEILKWNDLND